MNEILDFWFSDAARPHWFAGNPAFDAEIRARFLPEVEAALSGGLAEWERTDEGALALILLLDQFTRNLFRGTAKAFAGDARALALAKALVAQGRDAAMPGEWRHFLYLPFMHSERLADQEESVRLYTALGRKEALDYAIRHRDVIHRFGRFPQRNDALGRETTPEEAKALISGEAKF